MSIVGPPNNLAALDFKCESNADCLSNGACGTSLKDKQTKVCFNFYQVKNSKLNNYF